MLYQLYDFHRAALKPMRMWAEAAQTVFQNPYLPTSYTGFGRAVAAGAEMLERSTRRFGKPEFELTSTMIGGHKVDVTEQVVLSKPFCELRHFKRTGDRYDPKVLLVVPMSGHHATLLRGTVEALLPEHDVYVTDWVDARLVPVARGPFDLDDYIAYIMEFLQVLGPETHVVAVCQPAVPVLAAVSLLAQGGDACQPASMTLMGGPIDVTAAPTMPSRLAQQHPVEWFERTVISSVPPYYPGAFRKVFPGFIQLSGFMSMNLDRHIGAHIDLFRHLIQGDGESAEGHRRFYDEYLSVMDLPAEFYLQTVATVFHRHDLPRGTLRWRGAKVEPAAIRQTALMTVEGERDDISAPGQTVAAQRLCSGIPANRRDSFLARDVGHFGMFNGRRWREVIMPRVRAFIRRNDPGINALPAAAD
ncbi:MAG: polyhydroxyalkanoate depolymerase [Azospirillum sp.]|nr:polyhydroxyalkanoate depolymerase [Azospirillum sp.]